MKKNTDKVIDVIKDQAELFLLAAGEFYLFGTCMDNSGKILPVGAYTGEEHPPSADLIDLLEKDFRQGTGNGNYQIAIMALDILIRMGDNKYDGIELRFFEAGNEAYRKHLKYIIKENSVEFADYEE